MKDINTKDAKVRNMIQDEHVTKQIRKYGFVEEAINSAYKKMQEVVPERNKHWFPEEINVLN